MKNRKIPLYLFSAVLLSGIADGAVYLEPGTIQASQKSDVPYKDLRDWTPAVSTSVRYFGSDEVTVSPDGKSFFFYRNHGDVDCDCNIAELLVYSVEDVTAYLKNKGRSSHALKPLRRTNLRNLKGANWAEDNANIIFVGDDDKAAEQFYKLNIRSGAITTLTRFPGENYLIFDQGKLFYSLRANLDSSELAASPIVQNISHKMIMNALSSGGTWLSSYISIGEGEPWKMEGSSPQYMRPITFVSDGSKLLSARYPNRPPDGWSNYDNGDISVANQFMLTNVQSRTIQPVFDAPTGDSTIVGKAAQKSANGSSFWPHALLAEDQVHAILVNTALPLSDAKPERKAMAYIVGFNIATRDWHEIEPLRSETTDGKIRFISSVGWLEEGKKLLISHQIDGHPATGTTYELVGDRWISHEVDASVKLPPYEAAKAPTLPEGLAVSIRQSMNQPPVMVAAYGLQEVALSQPDPALKGVRIAPQQVFEWLEPDGTTHKGGLLLPHNRKGPVPLVIQAYNYLPDIFLPDGPAKHAYAAQSLVAEGMAVLNIDIPTEDTPPKEGPSELTAMVLRIDAIVEKLAKRRIIDRDRVGMIGFSRGGFDTSFAITHPRGVKLKAAVIDDAFEGTYSSSILEMSRGAIPRNHINLYGGTFWQNKAAWLELESSFNIDRVQTAALYTIHSQQNVGEAAGRIGAFALNRRPLEYLLFPNADHSLKKPRQRLASIEASVDWMRFWLMDELPSDKDRVQRWSKLKKDWKVQQAWEAAGHPVGSVPAAGFTAPTVLKH